MLFVVNSLLIAIVWMEIWVTFAKKNNYLNGGKKTQCNSHKKLVYNILKTCVCVEYMSYSMSVLSLCDLYWERESKKPRVWECEIVKMWKYESIRVWECERVRVWEQESVSVRVWDCKNERVCE